MALPTGDVLVVGGSRFADAAGTNAVLAPEIWDPATGAWTLLAPNSTYRGYHSSAVLLANGAVFLAGGGVPGPVNNFNAEVFYPPYLFRQEGTRSVLADRPEMISLSTNAPALGSVLRVQAESAAPIVSASLTALPMVTHSFDSNQRRIPVSFTTNANGVDVTMPGSNNLVPPGYYYLHLVDSNGVPSDGVIIAIGAEAPPAVTPPSGGVTFGTSSYRLGTPGLTWTAAAAEARAAGGKLVEINSLAENDFIRTNFATNGPVWIGLDDAATEGRFVNSTGAPPTYTNWLPGEPSDFGRDQDHVIMAGTDGRWDDMNNLGGWRFDGTRWTGGFTNITVIEFER